MVSAVRTDGEVRFTGKQSPFAFKPKTTAEFARTAAIRNISVAFNMYRILGFRLLNRDIASNVGGVTESVDPIAVGDALPRSPTSVHSRHTASDPPVVRQLSRGNCPPSPAANTWSGSKPANAPKMVSTNRKSGDAAHRGRSRHDTVNHCPRRRNNFQRFEHARCVWNIFADHGADTQRNHRCSK